MRGRARSPFCLPLAFQHADQGVHSAARARLGESRGGCVAHHSDVAHVPDAHQANETRARRGRTRPCTDAQAAVRLQAASCAGAWRTGGDLMWWTVLAVVCWIVG